MTQEEKQLLLKDLSARLPYGVKVNFRNKIEVLCEVHIYQSVQTVVGESGILYDADMPNVKPYLRPMSSMTEEEEILFRCELPTKAKTDAQLVAMRMELFLKGHLDYNHLIEKGLAFEAPEDMYKED